MNAGRLKERITIQKPEGANDHGIVKNTWATLATVWAEILAAGSSEVYRQSQVVADMSFVVRIRYRTDVTAKMRISWGSLLLEIIGIPFEEMVEGSRMLNLTCRRMDNQ